MRRKMTTRGAHAEMRSEDRNKGWGFGIRRGITDGFHGIHGIHEKQTGGRSDR